MKYRVAIVAKIPPMKFRKTPAIWAGIPRIPRPDVAADNPMLCMNVPARKPTIVGIIARLPIIMQSIAAAIIDVGVSEA